MDKSITSLTHVKEKDVKEKDKKKKEKAKESKKKEPAPEKSAHRKKSKRGTFDVPGVVHVALSEEIQKLLHCVVGEDVTAEKPWKSITKYYIQEELESEEIHADFNSFVPYKTQVIEYPGEQMLIGYIPDEAREWDEFYFCLNLEAEEKVLKIIKKIEDFQRKRLENTITKKVYKWTTLGSEAEVTEGIPARSRGLYMVELTSKYPILNGPVRFKPRLAQDVRDGCVDLLVPSRNPIPIVNKKRIHAASQIAPMVSTVEQQTICTYPKNVWTQYEYDCTFVKKIPKELLETFMKFNENYLETISDNLYVNYNMNLYTDDYTLLGGSKFIQVQSQLSNELMSFKDITRCKHKAITDITFHPMWSGIVAIAYGEDSPLWCWKGRSALDEKVFEAVHGVNPVLIWSFNDSLVPKLILETPCEVHALAFCPHNADLLAGGCENGQVVVWDLKQKIEKVETEEILTTAQSLYRSLMTGQLFQWFKNTKNVSEVAYTASSGLMYKHASNVTSIVWLHPLYKVTDTGQLVHFPELQVGDWTLQFSSTAADGTLKFWDLKQKVVILPGEYKGQRKPRRLKCRPTALTIDVSPFRSLNRKMRPHYQINVIEKGLQMPIASATLPYDSIIYNVLNPSPVYKITERLYYEPIIKNLEKTLTQSFAIGTYLGNFILGNWEGYEYSSGEVVCTEAAKIFNIGKYHDGPVLVVERHPVLPEVFLTVGGNVFAIWKNDFMNRPVFWRRSKIKYTYGCWATTTYYGIRLNKADGNREVWNLDARSDQYYILQHYSGKHILHTKMHPWIYGDVYIFGITDYRGSFRLSLGTQKITTSPKEAENFLSVIEHSAETKVKFKVWQEEWTRKHASWILRQKEEAEAEAQQKKQDEEDRKAREEEAKAQEAIELAKREAAKLKPPPGKYIEWAREQWITKEQERMGNVLLSKKQLDKATLIKQQLPLKIAEAEAEVKRHKQRQRVARSGAIFADTIATLFPDLAEQAVAVVEEVFSEEEQARIRKDCYEAYDDIKSNALIFVKENPYKNVFNWEEVLLGNKTRKRNAERLLQPSHKSRLETERNIDYTQSAFSIKRHISSDRGTIRSQETVLAEIESEFDNTSQF